MSDEEEDYLEQTDEEEEDEDDEDEPDTPPASGKKKKKKKKSSQSSQWKGTGKDAEIVARHIVVGDCDPHTFATVRDVCPEVNQWISSGKYSRDNLCRNYNKLVERIHLCLLKGTGFSKCPRFIRNIGLEGRGGSGIGLTGHDPDKKMAKSKKPTSSKGKKRPTTVQAGSDGEEADTPTAARAARAAVATERNFQDNDVMAGISEQFASSVNLGDGMPFENLAPRLMFVVDERSDPFFTTTSARNRLSVILTPGAGQRFDDFHASIVEEGGALLIRYSVNSKMRNAKFILGPFVGLDETFVTAFKKKLATLPKVVERRVPLPFKIEMHFRVPDETLAVAKPNTYLRRWRLSMEGGQGQFKKTYYIDAAVFMAFEVPKSNDDDLLREKDNLEVEDFQGWDGDEPETPPARAARDRSSRSQPRSGSRRSGTSQSRRQSSSFTPPRRQHSFSRKSTQKPSSSRKSSSKKGNLKKPPPSPPQSPEPRVSFRQQKDYENWLRQQEEPDETMKEFFYSNRPAFARGSAPVPPPVAAPAPAQYAPVPAPPAPQGPPPMQYQPYGASIQPPFRASATTGQAYGQQGQKVPVAHDVTGDDDDTSMPSVFVNAPAPAPVTGKRPERDNNRTRYESPIKKRSFDDGDQELIYGITPDDDLSGSGSATETDSDGDDGSTESGSSDESNQNLRSY